MLNKVKKQLEDMGYNVIGIFIQGSTNYGLDVYTDEYQSDFDMKAFVIPSFDDLYFNNYVSKVYKTNYGQVEVKDIRSFVDLIKKANPTYLELLYTKYWLGDKELWEEIRSYAKNLEEELRPQIIKAMCGTIRTKTKTLFGKDFHHAQRMLYMLEDFSKGESLANLYMFEGEKKEYLLGLKLGKISFNEDDVAKVDERAKEIYSNISWDNNSKFEYVNRINSLIKDKVYKKIKEV